MLSIINEHLIQSDTSTLIIIERCKKWKLTARNPKKSVNAGRYEQWTSSAVVTTSWNRLLDLYICMFCDSMLRVTDIYARTDDYKIKWCTQHMQTCSTQHRKSFYTTTWTRLTLQTQRDQWQRVFSLWRKCFHVSLVGRSVYEII